MEKETNELTKIELIQTNLLKQLRYLAGASEITTLS